MGQRTDQWLGNLFFRGCQPVDLMEMRYHVLAYWNEWHEVMTETERKALEKEK